MRNQIFQINEGWMQDCFMCLCRVIWQGWGFDGIQMVVLTNFEGFQHRRSAILRHQSQMKGTDFRLFWQFSEVRNSPQQICSIN